MRTIGGTQTKTYIYCSKNRKILELESCFKHANEMRAHYNDNDLKNRKK